jgi:tRNA(Ile)-lysidine synthase
MLEEFRNYIRENNLISQSDRILLAVSGGIDSMAMAHLFLTVKADFGIAHCNFNLRGVESDTDEYFVKQFALSHKIPFFSERFDTIGFASEKGISIQMAARELRYRWFEEISHLNQYSCISVAHNLNDNVETFLINLSRGTGIAGLTGMKPKYNNIIRPLLFATRKAIIDYCNTNHIAYREDKSNAETKYTRNKIRHVIIPGFKEINPSFETTIIETEERLNEINEIVTSHISGIRDKICVIKDDTIVFKINALQNLSPKLTILFELFRPYGIGKGQIDDLVKLINGKTGSQLITPDYILINNRKEILVSRREEFSENYFEISGPEDFSKYSEYISAEIKPIRKGFNIPSSSDIACLDADKLSYPMVIRKWKHGDSFYPLGMKHKKKLSDYFVDNKYSFFRKENCRILESEGKIVWIINDRIDNRFKILPSTKNVLIIKVLKSG